MLAEIAEVANGVVRFAFAPEMVTVILVALSAMDLLGRRVLVLSEDDLRHCVRLAPPETEMENFKVKARHDYHGDPMVFIVVKGNECARFGCWPEPATRTIKTGH
jgi:hypothetical protein